MTGLQVHVAKSDTGTKCCRCRAAIRTGEEFAIDRWPNGGGVDHLHVECPAPIPVDPDRPLLTLKPRSR